MNGFLLEIIAIFIGIALWDGMSLVFRHYRQKRIENIKCEICGKPRKIRLTKDRKVWACRSCRKVYNQENG